jgi:uncharacterized protein (DUF1697 family)
MTVVVAMLRGVNVGGHNVIEMEALREVFQSLQLAKPQTHIQSGNVIFGTQQKNLKTLARQIAGALEHRCTIHCGVILRTVPELRKVIAANPFAARPEIPPNRLLVNFLAADPGSQAHENIRKLAGLPEEVHLIGRELYIFYRDGAGRSKLTSASIDRALNTPSTARNWNTVVKLLQLAENWKP